jgi:hypothetical protein
MAGEEAGIQGEEGRRRAVIVRIEPQERPPQPEPRELSPLRKAILDELQRQYAHRFFRLGLDSVLEQITDADQISHVHVDAFRWQATVYLESGCSIPVRYRLDVAKMMGLPQYNPPVGG